MRAVIITGGSMTDYGYMKSMIRSGDTIICADSGYDHAVNMGVIPRVVVGDLDSISGIPEGVEIVRFSPEKDYTDTEIAIQWARERGISEFLMLGATGNRLDHTLANMMLLTGMPTRGEKGVIIDEHNRIYYTEDEIIVDEPVGTILSVIPVTPCEGVSNSGLKYPLDGAVLSPDTALGISNVVVSSPARVSVQRGGMFVVISKD